MAFACRIAVKGQPFAACRISLFSSADFRSPLATNRFTFRTGIQSIFGLATDPHSAFNRETAVRRVGSPRCRVRDPNQVHVAGDSPPRTPELRDRCVAAGRVAKIRLRGAQVSEVILYRRQSGSFRGVEVCHATGAVKLAADKNATTIAKPYSRPSGAVDLRASTTKSSAALA